MTSAVELVEELDRLRVKTGLWLLPQSSLGREVDEARRLCLEPVDIRTRLLNSLPEGTRFSGINSERILQLVDVISMETGDWAGALIYHFDILISRLGSDDRAYVWNQFRTGFPHRQRSVIVTMPAAASHLLPVETELTIWRRENRLAEPLSLESF